MWIGSSPSTAARMSVPAPRVGGYRACIGHEGKTQRRPTRIITIGEFVSTTGSVDNSSLSLSHTHTHTQILTVKNLVIYLLKNVPSVYKVPFRPSRCFSFRELVVGGAVFNHQPRGCPPLTAERLFYSRPWSAFTVPPLSSQSLLTSLPPLSPSSSGSP